MFDIAASSSTVPALQWLTTLSTWTLKLCILFGNFTLKYIFFVMMRGTLGILFNLKKKKAEKYVPSILFMGIMFLQKNTFFEINIFNGLPREHLYDYLWSKQKNIQKFYYFYFFLTLLCLINTKTKGCRIRYSSALTYLIWE